LNNFFEKKDFNLLPEKFLMEIQKFKNSKDSDIRNESIKFLSKSLDEKNDQFLDFKLFIQNILDKQNLKIAEQNLEIAKFNQLFTNLQKK
jgi:hypothetical protein